jgi:type IV pilus assembly protein PilM
MAKIQAVWALDVGQAALKALKLVPGENAWQVVAEAFDYVEYPKILSQPDADAEQLVREALETFLERNELKGCKVAIGVPGQAGLVKFIKLPPVEKKRIPDIVKFEARQQIPFSLDEVVWAYQQIGDDEGESDDDFTMAEVGLFAMKRDQINRAILPFRVAGIEVDIVQMGPIALYNFIAFDRIKDAPPPEPAAEGEENVEPEAPARPKLEKGSVVLLDIGADNTDLIITDGTRIWQRNVPIGGNHFTRALTKELKLTFAKAEHLKRNATKAPDPRSIFTAMRGVFNDFASEINRSIGFYSSVNRNAKIVRIIGLGNGFKLPGLQKFLQQNLSNEIEKLDGFDRMVGDDVKAAPQFQENLMSFAVAYGLGIQGLNLSGLRTNLLPPEIEQVRLIRAKKPWALAASALLMLGFTGLFLGDYRVLAKVKKPAFEEAVKRANETSKKGARFEADYAAAKNEWANVNSEGESLVAGNSERARWPTFFKLLNAHLPNPAAEYHLDPKKPADQPKLDKLQVHVDAIKPVWRKDLNTEWFSAEDVLTPQAKAFMHPFDRATPPSGSGWVVQIVGHHYNPDPVDLEAERKKRPGQRYDFGTYGYLLEKILPGLMTPDLRLAGVNHVTLAWLDRDRAWTSDTGSRTNGLASNSVPLLDRAEAPAQDATAMAPAATGGGSFNSGVVGQAAPTKSAGGAPPGMMNRADTLKIGLPTQTGPHMLDRSLMPGFGFQGMGPQAAVNKNLIKLTRTDFLIELVWQPPKPEDVPKTADERTAKLKALREDVEKAEKNNSVLVIPKSKVDELEAVSKKQSADLTKAVMQSVQAAAPPAAAAPPGPAGAAVPGPLPSTAVPGALSVPVATPAAGSAPPPGGGAAK